jgi:transposase-like protein
MTISEQQRLFEKIARTSASVRGHYNRYADMFSKTQRVQIILEAKQAGAGQATRIAKKYSINPRTFRNWIKMYDELGPLPRGKKSRRAGGGRRPRLPRFVEMELFARIKRLRQLGAPLTLRWLTLYAIKIASSHNIRFKATYRWTQGFFRRWRYVPT